MLMFLQSWSNKLWSTVSNAALRSNRVNTLHFPSSTDTSKLFTMEQSAVSVEYICLQAHQLSGIAYTNCKQSNN